MFVLERANSATSLHKLRTQTDHDPHQMQQNIEDAAVRRHSQGKRKAKSLYLGTNGSSSSSESVRSPNQSVPALIHEAIHTSISPPLVSTHESSFDDASPSPISQPPQAHHHSPLSPRPPQLLSQLTRHPASSQRYLSKNVHGHRSVTYTEPSQSGRSSSSWHRATPTTALTDDPFPDLDPSTGLPLESSPHRRNSASLDAPSLYLQRTITDILSGTPSSRHSEASYATNNSVLPSFPSISLPKVKLLTNPSLEFGKRNFSSSSAQDDWGSWAMGWWNGNKGKVDEMMNEDDKADTVEEEKEKLRKKYRSPKHPVVFCHGLLGFDYLGPASMPPLRISHWRGIKEVLESNGVEVLIARVPATSSIKERAQILAELISEKYPDRQVNLVGHSMGGLDCRYLISQLNPKSFSPVSLTTISTPHRGSPFADHVIDNLIGRNNLPSLLGLLEAMRLPHSGDGTAFSALRTNTMKEFNMEVVDDPDVKYYSWGAQFDPGLFDTFKYPHSVIYAKEGSNDGLVSVHSAMWGEYRGTLVGVNHLDLVGWVNSVRYAMAGWTGKPILFKPATFYLEVADYLAEQGF
ncbi:uncharacterized protein L203_105745 [Cryptococcus depauperatus CBS 7841]|uniref:DUF676 domain-containing protein n=1 Tax=Cryptococcus depauperatus CBS 7841 TaxID=1295531 RepID=A0AAJ8JY31_9TREE